jgi:hypothetical protein
VSVWEKLFPRPWRQEPHAVLEQTIADKAHQTACGNAGGLELQSVGESLRRTPSLTTRQVSELVALALRIERYMKCAQDIE